MKTKSNYYSNIRPEIVEAIPISIKTILDIGCGKGEFLKAVKSKTNAETWGVEMIYSETQNSSSSIDHFISGRIEDVIDELPDEYFDCITFNDVLEHLVEPQEVLRLISPKLKQSGFIVSSIPNVRYINNLYELLIKKDWEYKEEGILDSTHLRFFTMKSIDRLIESAGFFIDTKYGINRNKGFKVKILNLVTLGFFSDTQYLQFLIKAYKC